MEAELMYGLDQSSSSTSMNPAEDLHGLIAAAGLSRKNRNNTTAMISYNSANNDDEVEEEEDEQLLKARIASHPRYPSLLQAYIDCQKVGAPDEITSVLDDIMQSNNIGASNCTFRSDPELDKFMEMYCDVLVKYRSDLAKPLDEATTFLNNIETQLSDLCNSKSRSSRTISADDAVGSSEEEASGGENEMQPESSNFYKGENKDLKDKLLRKYSGYLGSLKQEFSKKKKKGKLPKEARQTLLEWWTSHYKWPYPTEADKIALAESTGLDQKQINNWFINQRKRHWKPSESMQFAVMGSLSAPFYED